MYLLDMLAGAQATSLLCYSGAARVMDLVDADVTLSDIVDRYGRPVHPDAREFLSYHTQAKRLLIKACVDDVDLRRRLREKEARQCQFYVPIGR